MEGGGDAEPKRREWSEQGRVGFATYVSCGINASRTMQVATFPPRIHIGVICPCTRQDGRKEKKGKEKKRKEKKRKEKKRKGKEKSLIRLL